MKGSQGPPSRRNLPLSHRSGSGTIKLFARYRTMQVLMPRFYFHIYQNGAFIRDEEGSTCPDLESARREAMACATDLASQALALVASVDEICVEICDEEDQVLAGLTIREILSSPENPALDLPHRSVARRLLH